MDSSITTGADEAELDNLAERVQEQFLAGWGVRSLSELRQMEDMPADSKVRYIIGFEDVSKGTVRALVHTDLTREEAERLGRNILTLTGFEVKELSTVVVRGIDGIDVNFFRHNIPALDS